jgi:hypothetical protein
MPERPLGPRLADRFPRRRPIRLKRNIGYRLWCAKKLPHQWKLVPRSHYISILMHSNRSLFNYTSFLNALVYTNYVQASDFALPMYCVPLTSLFSGASPRPRGSASRRVGPPATFCEAEQRFLPLFLEKEDYLHQLKPLTSLFWGQPQTPWLRFAEVWATYDLLRSRTTLFASFSGKRRLSPPIETSDESFLGPAPDPVAPLRGGLATYDLLRSRTTLFASFSGKRRLSPPIETAAPVPVTFCEAEQRFLLLFLEKEEYRHQLKSAKKKKCCTALRKT